MLTFQIVLLFLSCMRPVRLLFSLILILCATIGARSQAQQGAVTFEELYDEPYAINKLFIGLQPFYGEVFATNVNAGYGVEAHYFHQKKFDIKAHFRKSYSSKFFDFNRELALRNGSVTGKPEIFNYYELGGTYHIKDFDISSKTKIFLHKKSISRNRWAATVPTYAEVPCKLRKVYGVRAGAIIWNGTADLSRALEKQGLTNNDLRNASDTGLPDTYMDSDGQAKNLGVFGNIFATNVYIGGSMSWIRNIAVSFDKFDEGMDDGMLTVYADIMIAPSMRLDPVLFNGEEYNTSALATSMLGFRTGLEGRFNRTLGWAYGGEIGYRPSLQGSGFFALLKISFPVFSSNLDNKVEAFSTK